MTIDISTIGSEKIKNLHTGETVEIGSLWKNQNVVIIFFRRWGCVFCRLWAKELGEISHVLKEHNIKLIGIGVEEENSEDFIQGNFFDGDLYCVEDLSTYKKLGFKRFNTVTILTSLFWKQSRKAMSKSSSMDLGGDLKGDWVQTGGALLVKEGGKDVHHFIQTGPADHMDNVDILKHFGLEDEYVPETMANQSRDDVQCSRN
ncbi:prostamide/prostaglandin F synthase-like isoform X2 [Aricia agestis]|uniref:prostamide/prostaglandin F synthase-like isoform X2 n=1 Tax=Aricia agestis TaxID=91739 RepID=UPI001C208C71|nr:prostamide/prostaglandin F synthase-like isoform X2 [Aricia agestis]